MKIAKLIDVLNEIPVVNLVPLVSRVLRDIPDAWDAMPAEKKQEVIQNLIIAGAKMAAKA